MWGATFHRRIRNISSDAEGLAGHQPRAGRSPWPPGRKHTLAGSWRVEIEEQSQDEHCCWLQGNGPRGQEREETAVGNAFGGKPGSRGGRGATAEPRTAGRATTAASLPHYGGPAAYKQRKTQRGQPFEWLMSQAIEKDPSQGCPFNTWHAKQWRRTSQWGPWMPGARG